MFNQGVGVWVVGVSVGRTRQEVLCLLRSFSAIYGGRSVSC